MQLYSNTFQDNIWNKNIQNKKYNTNCILQQNEPIYVKISFLQQKKALTTLKYTQNNPLTYFRKKPIPFISSLLQKKAMQNIENHRIHNLTQGCNGIEQKKQIKKFSNVFQQQLMIKNKITKCDIKINLFKKKNNSNKEKQKMQRKNLKQFIRSFNSYVKTKRKNFKTITFQQNQLQDSFSKDKVLYPRQWESKEQKISNRNTNKLLIKHQAKNFKNYVCFDWSKIVQQQFKMVKNR